MQPYLPQHNVVNRMTNSNSKVHRRGLYPDAYLPTNPDRRVRNILGSMVRYAKPGRTELIFVREGHDWNGSAACVASNLACGTSIPAKSHFPASSLVSPGQVLGNSRTPVTIGQRSNDILALRVLEMRCARHWTNGMCGMNRSRLSLCLFLVIEQACRGLRMVPILYR